MTSPPLSDRMRPKSLDEFVGQEHLVGEGKVVRRMIEEGQIHSMILWGPPGSGKTTLARIIANDVEAEFLQLSATMSGVKEIREAVKQAKDTPLLKKGTILFIDEIHRFNKAQQDSLLPHVENGTFILIGATTENPSFEVNSALLSRARVLVLQPLGPEHVEKIVKRAMEVLMRASANGRGAPTCAPKRQGADMKLEDSPHRLGRHTGLPLQVDPEALDFLVQASNGDARVALNAVELAVSLSEGNFAKVSNVRKVKQRSNPSITLADVKEALQKSHLLYDRAGEEHYNTISAFIKSMRASNVNAALYYLARMVEAGEDPKFIARRMVIFASEDVGMAQPTALVVANEVFKACEMIGYPECQINLAHGTVYLASAKKDRSTYDAYFMAKEDVQKYGNLPIPMQIRNAPTKLMKELGYGKGYDAYTKESLLPEKLKGKKYY